MDFHGQTDREAERLDWNDTLITGDSYATIKDPIKVASDCDKCGIQNGR